MTTLITGANGTISSDLLASLAATSDVRLRALVRDARKAPDVPGVEIAVGDLERPSSLADAFSGVVAEVVAREYSAALAAAWADLTTPDFTAVAGRPARTIADFARDHRSAFGSSPANGA